MGFLSFITRKFKRKFKRKVLPAPTAQRLFPLTQSLESSAREITPVPSSGYLEGVHDKIQNDFEKFHSANPLVYQLLVSSALRVKARGYKQYGIKTLYELVRWHHDINVGPNSETFKMNNNFTSRYARLIMDNVPQLEGFFRLRELN